ncbi:MAG: transketolase [Nitrospirae bacterium]|nr:transketolase [Nitrospirota bacterium]
MRNAFVNTLISASMSRDDIFIVTGDNGAGVFDAFMKNNPNQFINLGIAEQNLTSVSAGLAMSGYKVCTYNIIPFLLYRCYEQVRNDICYQELPVIMVGIGSGVTYAPQGLTHYSVEDIGIAQTLPNLIVISPCDPIEAKCAAKYAINADKPVYVRIPKRGEPVFHKTENLDITIPQVLRQGEDIALIFHGNISEEVMNAYDKLVERHIYPMIISVPIIQPLNVDSLFDILKNIKTVIAVEEHYENCGFGGILRQAYHQHKPSWKLKVMGIPFKFIHEIKNTSGMRSYFGILAGDIVNAVNEEREKI